ncbi:MAG TPA: heme-binding domain-containing protein [Sunxiuqinia sp.]|nr:heme-binding domain-containing protein [Sunxiuqinia sp.]
MQKKLRLIGIIALVLFVLIQLYRPKKNNGAITREHLYKQEQVPAHIQTILNNACMDCHSNHTNYLWYHEIAPVSWLVRYDINEGKGHINFSEWGKLDVFDKIGDLDDLSKAVKSGEMPISMYSMMHKKARLSQAERDTLVAWSARLSESLINRNAGD